MIAIPESLIRSVRRLSAAEEDSSVERMLSSSPRDSPVGDAKDVEPELAPAEETRREEPQQQPQQNNVVKNVTSPRGPGTQPAALAANSFAKVPVERKVLSSSLSKELLQTAALRNARFERQFAAARAGPTLVLRVFFPPDDKPMKMKISGSNTVEEVIDLILRHHSDQKRKPALKFAAAECYDLRMVDDDDGSPDMDIPPLERTRDIHQINVNAVALCERPEPVPNTRVNAAPSMSASASAASTADTRKKRGISQEILMKTGKIYLKVHMPKHVSHIIPVTNDMTLQDILPLIAKKRSSEKEEILPQHYKFVHNVSDKVEIDMKLKIQDLNTEELTLLPRVSLDDDLKTIPETEILSSVSSRPLSREEAVLYQEFKVVKTNQRGKKQERIMGIDQEKIYNKNPLGSNQDDVHRPYRLISEVASVEVLVDQPRCFRLTFKDKSGTEVRDYEADSRVVAQQIVSKIKFLRG